MNRLVPNLEAIRMQLHGQQAITRFAPSPTGYLHLGHVVNAIYVWGIAGALGGKVLLRIEDHDRQRCRPEYEQAIHEDLAWLGFKADIGTPEDFSTATSPYRQSDCHAHYEHALDHLRKSQHIYACDCSRKDIQSRFNEPAGPELRYDGFCRERQLPDGPKCGIRLQIPPGEVTFRDLLAGPQIHRPLHQTGDLLLRDRNHQWTYQFAVVADDVRQGINLVIRGMDILESTGRQLLLGRMLSPEPVDIGYNPVFLHHPLLTDDEGRKLSKRDFDADIHELNLAGQNPQTILGRAAAIVGLIPEHRNLSADEVSSLF
jgi:glutamyl-tRNA synthetase/glutamyl-Q tRNA(Asp) synthetase